MPADRDLTEPPALVFSRAAIREVDRLAAEEFVVPSIVLMENAAAGATWVAMGMLGRKARPRVMIVCGPGNNGGDGLAMARHLSNVGADVRVVLAAAPERSTGDAGVNLRVVERMGIPCLPPGRGGPAEALRLCVRGHGMPDLVIDAILGTGLEAPVRSPLLELIAAVNSLAAEGVPVLAVDIPSGLDADTGRPLGDAVRATVTATLAGLKQGFLALEAQPFVGEVVVVGIGAPRALLERLGRAAPGPGSDSLPPEPPPGPERPGSPHDHG
jgi:hydroxyethylthiazole kinase-like uncharacterized protein yjeF